MINLLRDDKYWSEVFDVLNLRVARFLKLPHKIHDSIHENTLQVFSLIVHCVTKAVNSRNSCASGFNWGSMSLLPKHSISSHLHEAGYKCDLFATGVRQKILSISKITQWPIVPSIPLIIFYISLKLELVALARAIGLFEIHDKEEVKNTIVYLIQSQDLSEEDVMGIPLKNFLTISPPINVSDLIELFVNKRFQDAIDADGSVIALITLVIAVLLKNHRELWEKCCNCMGLSEKINLAKAVNHLKYINENSIEIDRILKKLLNDPLEENFEDENDLLNLYNSCLRNITRFRKVMRIFRRRTFFTQNFYPTLGKVVIKYTHKEKELCHDLIIPFPPYYKLVWEKEAITVDSIMWRENNKITSLSLTPTDLKSIKGIGYEYESNIKRIWENIWSRVKKYSKKFLWRIIAIGLFIGGVLVLNFKYAIFGTILLTLGSLLLSPLIQEWYSKKRQTQENKM